MGEIEKMDAFSVVVKYLDSGNVATAKKTLQIIVRAMQQEKKSNRSPSSIRIEDDKDAKEFHELYLRVME